MSFIKLVGMEYVFQAIKWLLIAVLYVVILFFVGESTITGQMTRKIVLNKESQLPDFFSQLHSASTPIAFDHNIVCRPTRPSPLTVYFDNIEGLLEKIACYCQLDVEKVSDSTFLVRNTTSTDKFYILSFKEAQSHQGISYASIKTFPNNKNYISDLGGEIYIRMKANEKIESLTLQSLTFGKQEILWNDIEGNTILLQPKAFKLKTILHKNTSLNPIKHSRGITLFDKSYFKNFIPYNQFTNMPGALSMLLPGTQIVHDKTSQKALKSAEQANVLLTIDDMPVYKTDHFFGIFSAINPDFIDKITIHRNTIPIHYGGRTSHMMEYKSPTVIDNNQLQIHANLLYSSLAGQIKVSDNFGILVSGRYTYVNLLQSHYFDAQERIDLLQQNTLININNTLSSRPDFDFYDLNFKTYFTHKNHTITLSSFHSEDKFEDNQDLEIRTRLGTRTLNIFQRDENWRNETYMLKHTYKNNRYQWTTQLYNTQFSNNQNLRYRLREQNLTTPDGTYQTLINSNTVNDKGIKTIIEKSILKKSKLLVGAESINHANSLDITGQNNTFFEYISSPWEHSAFAHVEHVTGNYWMFRPALRATFVPSINRLLFQPQVYLQKYIHQDWKIKTSYARLYSLMRQFIYETPTGLVRSFFAFSNESSIPIGVADNGMVGLQYNNEDKGINVDIELFYRNMEGALNYATRQIGVIKRDQNLGLNDFNLFRGQSRFYGSEIVISYSKENFRWINQYTWSLSEQRFPEIFNNSWHVTPQDSRHQFRSLVSQNIKNWVVSLAYSGASGLPYQDILKARAVGDRRLLTPDNVISRLPDFHRWDTGLQYVLKINSKSLTLGCHIYNIFDRNNVTQRQFLSQINTSTTQIIELESDVLQLGRVFNIGMSLSL